GDGFRVVQLTPHNSGASVIFGKGVTSAKPGSAGGLVLAVDDIDASRDDLIPRGVDGSGGFPSSGRPSNNPGEHSPLGGRRPHGRSYYSFASLEDPDGNGWLLQEIRTRLPGREWQLTRARAMDVATLAELLRETAEHHDQYEKTHAKHDWWDWYAPYLSARQSGSSPEEAAAAADRHMDGILHVASRWRILKPPRTKPGACPRETRRRGFGMDQPAGGSMTTATTIFPPLREPQLLGQTVVVIGGSSGIGLETARCARAEGAAVVLTGRN